MKCTDCSEVVKPVVALDIDGTLGDYHAHFLRFAEAYLAREAPRGWTFDGSEKFNAWFCREFEVNYDVWGDIKLAYRQGAQKRSMPTYPHASTLVKKIKAAGAEIWMTTTRPHLRLDNIDPDTRFWLDRRDIKYDYMLYGDDKYKLLKERVGSDRVAAVLEDLPEQVLQAMSLFGKDVVVVRKTQWNSATVMGTDSLQEAAIIITHKIEEWKESHD